MFTLPLPDVSFPPQQQPSPRKNLALLQVIDAVCKNTCDCLTLTTVLSACNAIDFDYVRELATFQRHLLLSIREGTKDVIYTLNDLKRFIGSHQAGQGRRADEF